MTSAPTIEVVTHDLDGIALTVEQQGEGPNVVVVHGEDGTLFLDPFIVALASACRVHVLHLPGWGVTPPSADVDEVGDLALLVTDYVAAHAPEATVVGLSFGGWVVAHAAVVNGPAFERIVLVAPVGIKTVARDERSYVDLWATSPEALADALYSESSNAPDLADADDDVFLRLAQANEAVARFGWEPYLHDPRLARRLRRLRLPTLVVTGTEDHFVLEPDSGSRWCELIGAAARHASIDGVGHRPEEEAPDRLASLVADFANTQPD